MKYFVCEICGNLVELIEEGGGELVCCGQPMKELKAKTNDEGNEKHLPVISDEGSKIYVKVGSIEHPMTEEHHIEWIAIYYNNKTQKIKLDHNSKPEAIFEITENYDSIQVYSYCNIHGLWKTEIKKL